MTIDLAPVEDTPSSQETSTSESENGTTSEEASVGNDVDDDLNISLQSTEMEQTHPPEHSKVSSSVYLSHNQEEPRRDDHTPTHPVPSSVSPQIHLTFSPVLSSLSPSIEINTPSPSQVPLAPSPTLPSIPSWSGFKICGDNLDKTMHRRHIRCDQQNKTLHYFHSYAVKDQVNLQDLSDAGPKKPSTISEVLEKVEPNAQENALFIDECAVLLSRIMCDNMPYFIENYEDVVQRHIPHMYKQEMSSKSEVVCKSSIV